MADLLDDRARHLLTGVGAILVFLAVVLGLLLARPVVGALILLVGAGLLAVGLSGRSPGALRSRD